MEVKKIEYKHIFGQTKIDFDEIISQLEHYGKVDFVRDPSFRQGTKLEISFLPVELATITVNIITPPGANIQGDDARNDLLHPYTKFSQSTFAHVGAPLVDFYPFHTQIPEIKKLAGIGISSTAMLPTLINTLVTYEFFPILYNDTTMTGGRTGTGGKTKTKDDHSSFDIIFNAIRHDSTIDDFESSVLSTLTYNQMSLLHYAILYRNISAINYLLLNKIIDPNSIVCIGNLTPLEYLIYTTSPYETENEIIKLLKILQLLGKYQSNITTKSKEYAQNYYDYFGNQLFITAFQKYW